MRWICLLLLWPLFSLAQTSLRVYDYWDHLPAPNLAIYDHIQKTALNHLEGRKKHLLSLQGEEDWQHYRKEVKSKLVKLFGEMPDKSPLNPHMTGRIEEDKYIVEKLYFEALPEYYVSAALFIPHQRQNPAPAILFCSGHSDLGFRSDVYQHMILNYVHQGFVVLAFDPVGQGERNHYLDEHSKPVFRPTHEHSHAGNQAFVAGIPSAQYFLWDAIRALDYLITRPEVDSLRIGVTGRSGGGTQTAYLMAMDDRVAVAAPECYLTSFKYLLPSGGPQDAEQNIPGFLSEGLDLGDLIVARAPKPTLMITTTRDIFSIQGARDIYREVAPCYQSLHASDSFEMVEDDAPHQSTIANREAAYAFFNKHLNNNNFNADQDYKLYSPEELWVSSSGQVIEDFGGRSLFELNADRFSRKINQKRSNILGTNSIAGMMGYTSPGSYSIVYGGGESIQGGKVHKYLIGPDDRYKIPLVWISSDTEGEKLLLMTPENGKPDTLQYEGFVQSFLEEGYDIVLVDLSGVGEMQTEFTGGDARLGGVPLNVWYGSLLNGQSITALRASEIAVLLEFVRDQDYTLENIYAYADGVLCSDWLWACALGIEVKHLSLFNPLLGAGDICHSEYYNQELVMSQFFGSGLISSDVLLGQYAPDDLRIQNPINANGKVNTMVKQNNQVRISDEPVERFLMNWLR